MVLQSPGDISSLPVQLLANILQFVDSIQERLLSCALVSRTWNSAAVLSTRTISIPRCTPAQAQLLFDWLQQHSVAAPISSIRIQSILQADSPWQAPRTHLQLPQQQLQALRELDVTNAYISTGGHPVLDPALLSLTSLVLRSCQIDLQGVSALTGLQRLSLSTPHGSGLEIHCSRNAVVEALPSLSHLTSLLLAGKFCSKHLVAQASCLTRLQDLELLQGGVDRHALAHLPSSLTRVSIEYLQEHDNSVMNAVLHISPSSTSALGQLTALQELCCPGVSSFHCAILTGLTGLTKLAAARVTAAAGEPRLVVLTGLTRLRHLELLSFTEDDRPAERPEDYAAVISSPQLTHLHLGCYDILEFEHCHMMFALDRAKPNLRSLRVGMVWMVFPHVMDEMARCCTNLQQLYIDCPGWALDAEERDFCIESFGSLRAAVALTKLDFHAAELQLTVRMWGAIASLSTLQHLTVHDAHADDLGGMMQLTSCRQLTKLTVQAQQVQHPDFAEGGGRITITAVNEAPDGAPPDVWRQIPALVLSAAAENFEQLVGKPEALHSLLRAGAGATQSIVQRQVELEQEVQGLRQQVAEMQRSMAAVLAQLQLPTGTLQQQQQKPKLLMSADSARCALL